MFPEEEIIRLNENIFIHKVRENVYQVWFKSESQYFPIGIPMDTEEEAMFIGSMFNKALFNYKNYYLSKN